MEFKTVTQTAHKIERIMADRDQILEGLKSQISDAEAVVKSADAKMEEATRNGDVSGYKTAKARLEDANTTLEMVRKRYDIYLNQPLISQEEYKNQAAAIMDECQKACDDLKQKLVKLSEDMYEAGEEVLQAISKANKVLAEWQEKIYRGADRARDKNGNYYMSDALSFGGAGSVIYWSRLGVQSPHYQNATGNQWVDDRKGGSFLRKGVVIK